MLEMACFGLFVLPGLAMLVLSIGAVGESWIKASNARNCDCNKREEDALREEAGR